MVNKGSRHKPTRISAEVAQAIAETWGSAAAAALTAEPSPFADGADVTIGNPGALPWPQQYEMAVPRGSNRPFFYVGDRWTPLYRVDAVRALIEGVRPGVDDAAAIHAAFELLDGARVVRDEAEVERLCTLAPQEGWVRQPTPAPREARELFEPPYVDGRRVVFQTNQPEGWMRIVVDTETCSIDRTRLCDAANEGVRFYLRGRGYDGVVADVVVERPMAPTSSSQWVEAARAEHASIASFARATLELLAVGAPLDLLARMQRAALDEIEHTRMSLDLARAVDGVDVELGAIEALPPRTASPVTAMIAPTSVSAASSRRVAALVEVARNTLLEAALPESHAVDDARRRAAAAVRADERAAYERIAREEAEHAALAWDIVAWCVSSDDTGAVQRAIDEATARHSRELTRP